MKLRGVAFLALAFLAGAGMIRADQSDPTTPVEVDLQEETKVRLVLLDVVVLDRQDRTVPDLTPEDFEVVMRGGAIPIDTLDVNCDQGRLDDPIAVRQASKRPAAAPLEGGRRIALVLDYLHLNRQQQVEVLEQAKQMVEHNAADNDEFLVAALTGGLRIEQPLTGDREAVLRTLHRMEYDISLWNGHFEHLNSTGFVEGLTTLLDVLGTVDGNKAVVLFSAMSDVPLDLEFQRIAAVAATSRCSIYPVDARGLQPLRPGGTPEGGG